MRIKQIHLNDFKCYKDVSLNLGRITLLTGANSSGKSSIIQSILGPLQSSDFPSSLSTNGKYANLGDFEEISYMHDKSKIIHLDYVIEFDKYELNLNTSWKFDKVRRIPKLYTLSATTSFYNLEIIFRDEKYHLTYSYSQEKETGGMTINDQHEMSIKLNQLLDQFILPKTQKASKEELNTKRKREEYYKKLQEKFKRNNKKIRFSFEDIESIEKMIDGKGSVALENTYRTLRGVFNGYEAQFNFISSFRNNPRRTKFEIAKTDMKVGRHGENFEDQIVLWELKKSPELNKLVTIMRELKLFESIVTKRVEGGNYHLRIKTHKGGAFSSITDVGFGISQFLPIIVADIQLNNESTLIVSQPEIHLHPSVQSEFGNYLADKVSKTKKNYIIETHSEYLINKLRVLITKKELLPENLQVYYLSNKGKNVEVHNVQFTEKGEILNAPPEFFDTYMMDIMEIALNA